MVPLTLPVLVAIYGLVIRGCTVVLRLVGVSAKTRVVLSFMVFGVTAGLLIVWQWPGDMVLVYNFPAAILGDEIYQWSIQLFGDPTSSNAHETIPWFLRIPQVLAIASVVFWGQLGSLVQFAVNRPRRPLGIPCRGTKA